MKPSGLAMATLGFSLLHAAAASAGLYNTAEKRIEPEATAEGAEPLPFLLFWQDLRPDLLKINADMPETPQRKHYLAQRDQLQSRVRAGSLSVTDRVNLSEYLIRLRQYNDAIEVLRPAAAQERQNFMLFANLATAYQQSGQTVRAIDYLTQVRDLLRQAGNRPGLSPEQVKWLEKAEGYHLKLVRLRNREAQSQPPGRVKPPESVDDLFGVRFVGDSGSYEAGKLAAVEQKKLPKDAIAIVQQLLIWLPDDTRLYWLLGELYNTNGDLMAADKIFEDCVWSRRFDAATLREHRQIVQAAIPKPEPPQPPTPWQPEDWQLWTVGVGAGLLVGVLAYWQVRELLRRRSRVTARSRNPVS